MNQIILMFIIIVLGLLLGRISFFGVKLGLAGVLLIGLVFGHYGFEIDSFINNLGLLLFVTGVGFTAGPIFINNFKSKALPYITIATVTILFSAFLIMILSPLFGVPTALSLGVMTGALTSTPGLGAAVEATQSNLASVGYGIAYPFGVIGVILFLHLTVKVLKINPKKEAEEFVKTIRSEKVPDNYKEPKIKIDGQGFFPFFLAIIVGILVGMITIPIPGGGDISLGNAGGALLSGLFFGHLGRIGELSLKFNVDNSKLLSDLGLIFFFVGTGVNAGTGALEVLKEYGLLLFFIGAMVTVLSALVAFLVGYFIFKLNVVDILGAVTGAMTSTPGLGALIDITDSPSVAASYASTYPLALFLVILLVQLLNGFM